MLREREKKVTNKKLEAFNKEKKVFCKMLSFLLSEYGSSLKR